MTKIVTKISETTYLYVSYLFRNLYSFSITVLNVYRTELIENKELFFTPSYIGIFNQFEQFFCQIHSNPFSWMGFLLFLNFSWTKKPTELNCSNTLFIPEESFVLICWVSHRFKPIYQLQSGHKSQQNLLKSDFGAPAWETLKLTAMNSMPNLSW